MEKNFNMARDAPKYFGGGKYGDINEAGEGEKQIAHNIASSSLGHDPRARKGAMVSPHNYIYNPQNEPARRMVNDLNIPQRSYQLSQLRQDIILHSKHPNERNHDYLQRVRQNVANYQAGRLKGDWHWVQKAYPGGSNGANVGFAIGEAKATNTIGMSDYFFDKALHQAKYNAGADRPIYEGKVVKSKYDHDWYDRDGLKHEGRFNYNKYNHKFDDIR